MRRELLVKYALSSMQSIGQRNSVHVVDDDELMQVESHLLVCPACNLRVKAYRQLHLNNQAVSAEMAIHAAPLSECVDEDDVRLPAKTSRSHTFYRRMAVAALVLLAAVGLSLVAADYFTKPQYYHLASVRSDQYDQIILYRERNSLLQAIFLFRSGDYEKAIAAIEASISTRDGYNMRPYLRFMQGLAYLKLAESSTYGLFPRFDMNRVETAIAIFQACIDEATSAEMSGVRASAYIYQAKAYLMNGNTAAAQQDLRQAVQSDDEMAEQAAYMLKQLPPTTQESNPN